MAASAGTGPNTLVDGRFELLAPLEDQGLGESWKARDTNLKNRQVALKFLRALPSNARELPPELAAHFKRLKSLRHAYVLATTHYGIWEGRPFVVQDLFEGPSLGTGLTTDGEPLPVALLERFFDRVAACIEATHGAKSPVVHGALHPGCILIQRLEAQSFDVRVTDFGLAPYAGVPSVLLAPEAASGSAPAASMDVFGLGWLMRSMFGARASASHRREDVAAEVWQAMRTATQTRPEDRFASVSALRESFQSAWTATVTPLTKEELAVDAAPVSALPRAQPQEAQFSTFSQATVAMPNPHQGAAPAPEWAQTAAMPNPHLVAAPPAVEEHFVQTVHVPNVNLGRSPWDVPGHVYAETVAMPANMAVKLPYGAAASPQRSAGAMTPSRAPNPRPSASGAPSSARVTMIAVGTTIAVTVIGLVLAGLAWVFLRH